MPTRPYPRDLDRALAGEPTTTAEIADLAVTTAKIAADAVDGTKVADGAIDTEHLAADAVETAKIADGNVTTDKLAADAVNGTKVADGAIDTEHLAADAVETAKIADGNVTFAKMAVFVSSEQTGTGSSQNVAHGGSTTPSAVLVAVTDLPGGASGVFDVAEGSHDGTNVVVTVTSGVKFKVIAFF